MTQGKETTTPIRNYKDSVFRMLFSEPESLLSLYNALNGTDYSDPEELEVNTLENAIYLGRKNDISFIIQSQMYLYEQQSTTNPNIPLRNLFYVASLYTRMVSNRNLFSSKAIHLPKPYFVVFYNGTDTQPERRIFRLSELYEPKTCREMIKMTGEQPDMELKTLAININKGYNEELKKSCRDLYGYITYVDKVREFAKNQPLEKAVERAITHCIENDILAEFLSKRRAEVMSMSIFEYDQEKHFRQIAEENMAEGWEKGRQAGRDEGIAIGKAEGKAEGRAEGRAEGKAEGKRLATLENIRSLMDSLGTSAEQAMAVLKIPAEEQKTYAEQLKEYSEMN